VPDHSPLIVIPGIQGRWEWMRPTVAALSGRRDVRTFSLDVDDGHPDSFEAWAAEIDRLIDATGGRRATLVAVSFGGLVGVHYAARRPDRVRALVLASSPSPRMALGAWERRLIAHPRLLLPLFGLRGLQRLLPEVWAAHDSVGARLSFMARHGWEVLRRPMSPKQSARWVRTWQDRQAELLAACARVTAPTRILIGEPALDRVVPTHSSLDYLQLIAGATVATLPRTGHIGLVSRPGAFAALVNEFLDDLDDSRTCRTA
jgi:3-oxoadipate enol-lactonase